MAAQHVQQISRRLIRKDSQNPMDKSLKGSRSRQKQRHSKKQRYCKLITWAKTI